MAAGFPDVNVVAVIRVYPVNADDVLPVFKKYVQRISECLGDIILYHQNQRMGTLDDLLRPCAMQRGQVPESVQTWYDNRRKKTMATCPSTPSVP